MAQTVYFVPVEAASREDEPRDETQILWLELEVLVASPWCQRDLVCAGPGGAAIAQLQRSLAVDQRLSINKCTCRHNRSAAAV